MSMGYGSNYADVISDADIEKLCPKEWENFVRTLAEFGSYIPAFAVDYKMGESPREDMDECDKAWNDLVVAFRYATATGNSYLTLELGYHDSSDEGDRYDDVDGYFFHVNGAYELSPAGKKCEKMIDRKFFVTFG